MLVEHVVNMSAKNEDGFTPLHLASQEGHIEVARIIIEGGADVMVQNKEGSNNRGRMEWYRQEQVAYARRAASVNPSIDFFTTASLQGCSG
jgi:hypothetical protein